MKKFQELKEYLGGFRLGSFPTLKPMASLGDKGPKTPAGQQSLGVGINANNSVSTSLQCSIGFFQPPLPAQLSAIFTDSFPIGRNTGLPCSVCRAISG